MPLGSWVLPLMFGVARSCGIRQVGADDLPAALDPGCKCPFKHLTCEVELVEN